MPATPPRVAILGAGPVGLEAALYAAALRLPFTVYERGRVGEHLRRWGHVRLFSPFGILFEEVTASNLVEVDIAGALASGAGNAVNPAGWIVHRTTYEAVPDAQCVMHLHTIAGTAVSAQRRGLLPINQFAVTYFGNIAYHDYDGPGLRPAEQKAFAAALGDKRMMFLRNHGTLTVGRSIPEAFTLMHYLERTCEIQVAAQAGGELALPKRSVIDATVATAQGVGDRRFGEVGFKALLRKLDRDDPSYRD